jgi:hypothetical protein
MMARRASLQLKIHGKVVNTVPLELEDLEVLVELLRDATPLRPRDMGKRRHASRPYRTRW